MTNGYLKLPLRLQGAMEGNELGTCDLVESITQHLQLIVVSRFGEHRADQSFGCEIWDLDFELIVSARLWEEKLRHSLLHSITHHEPRLLDVEVSVMITDIEKFNMLRKFTEVKKRVDIVVSATIRKNGEPFFFKTNMFLSPLTMD